MRRLDVAFVAPPESEEGAAPSFGVQPSPAAAATPARAAVASRRVRVEGSERSEAMT